MQISSNAGIYPERRINCVPAPGRVDVRAISAAFVRRNSRDRCTEASFPRPTLPGKLSFQTSFAGAQAEAARRRKEGFYRGAGMESPVSPAFQQQIKDFKPKVISPGEQGVTPWKRGDGASALIVLARNPRGTFISFSARLRPRSRSKRIIPPRG